MTSRSAALGASLLILSFAAPAWADEAKPAPPKAAAPSVKATKPPPAKTKDHETRHASEDRDDKAEGDKHDKDRRHDRD
ncbi:hypothetical protein [Caulobacter segnis]|uniref:hypothetical protein n=1 Tax=Caulobacter segnis TaxID=88688 RepID=UPI00286714E1|nr:hypothetical protein [Caulobacter segnis]MDR6627778.1 hypothetical protein [Caulobacter segnis]